MAAHFKREGEGSKILNQVVTLLGGPQLVEISLSLDQILIHSGFEGKYQHYKLIFMRKKQRNKRKKKI